MKDIYENLSKQEKEDMENYQKMLAKEKEEKLKEMEEKEALMDDSIIERRKARDNLSAVDQALLAREMASKKAKRDAEKAKQAVISSEDVINKMKADHEAAYAALGGAFEEERKRQLDLIEEKKAARREAVEKEKVNAAE